MQAIDKIHLYTKQVGEVVTEDHLLQGLSPAREAQELAWILYFCTNSGAREEIEKRAVEHYNSHPDLAPIDPDYLRTSMLVSIRSLVVDYLQETGQTETAGWIRSLNE